MGNLSIRLCGTQKDCKEMIEMIKKVVDVVRVSKFFKNFDSEKDGQATGRMYIEVK